MNARILPVIVAALVSLSACGSFDSDATPPTDALAETSADVTADSSGDSTVDVAGAENTVTISRSRFDNTELRVPAGTTVTFVNTDGFDHTITSKDGSPVEFDSGTIGQDETFEFTFEEPGEYPYFCQIHPTMRAVVIVG